MPIFMDRHDMRGATAENVAEAHRKDLEIQDKYGVKYMTYWYDSERSAGFCLVDAPDAATSSGPFSSATAFPFAKSTRTSKRSAGEIVTVWRRLVPKENPRPCKNLGGAS